MRLGNHVSGLCAAALGVLVAATTFAGGQETPPAGEGATTAPAPAMDGAAIVSDPKKADETTPQGDLPAAPLSATAIKAPDEPDGKAEDEASTPGADDDKEGKSAEPPVRKKARKVTKKKNDLPAKRPTPRGSY